ncbi:MAG: hypothetical protein ACPL3C_03155 [Pyrobaculum sp.]
MQAPLPPRGLWEQLLCLIRICRKGDVKSPGDLPCGTEGASGPEPRGRLRRYHVSRRVCQT